MKLTVVPIYELVFTLDDTEYGPHEVLVDELCTELRMQGLRAGITFNPPRVEGLPEPDAAHLRVIVRVSPPTTETAAPSAVQITAIAGEVIRRLGLTQE